MMHEKDKQDYLKPVVKKMGSLEIVTKNSDSGGDPENFQDNIVWGNYAPEYPEAPISKEPNDAEE